MTSSPPWSVAPWPDADGTEKVLQQFAPIRAILEAESTFVLRDPAVSGWSAGEHAGHLAIITGRMATAIETNLRQPDRDRDRGTADFLYPILESGRFPRGVAKAPPETEPGDRDRTELLNLLDDSERRWRALEPEKSRIDSCASRFAHHRFGFMTAREWLRLATIHTAHHLVIVNEIRDSDAAK